jgi:hypothetical protein
LVDALCRFIFVYVGSSDRVNDVAVFRNSTFNAAMECNLLSWSDNSVLIGDDAFPLKHT